MRLWIDTDVGTNPDDAVALVCAVAHPDVDLVGVSVGDGENDIDERIRLARALVEAPVVAGVDLSARDVTAVDPDAFLAIGPLATVAGLLAAGVVPPRLGIMGGVLRPVRHRGAIREIEHNFGAEPEAARAVIDHALGILLCPLDVTVRMRPSRADLRRLAEAVPELRPLFEDWVARQRDAGVPDDEAAVRLHDPLALLALIGEPVVDIERRALTIDEHAQVHEDAGRGRPIDVVVDADVGAALKRICALVARTEAPDR